MPVFSRRIEKLVWDHRRRGEDPWAVVGRLYERMWEIREQRDRYEARLYQPGETHISQRQRVAQITSKRSVIYYVEREAGGLIKIGRSVQLQSRLSSLRCGLPDLNLLAVEPGGANIESQRHRRFAALRQQGEWFEPGEELLEHIAGLQPKD